MHENTRIGYKWTLFDAGTPQNRGSVRKIWNSLPEVYKFRSVCWILHPADALKEITRPETPARTRGNGSIDKTEPPKCKNPPGELWERLGRRGILRVFRKGRDDFNGVWGAGRRSCNRNKQTTTEINKRCRKVRFRLTGTRVLSEQNFSI